jgi:hypothetical protein
VNELAYEMKNFYLMHQIAKRSNDRLFDHFYDLSFLLAKKERIEVTEKTLERNRG